MRAPVGTFDLLRFVGGVAVAAAAGLALGSAMRPNLNEGEIKGPQQPSEVSGARAQAAADPGVGAYRGQPPEHVLGTDWTRPRAPEPAASDEIPADPAPTVVATPAQIAPPRWRDEPRPPPRYPSEQGNTYNPSDLPPPPAAPDDATPA